MINENLFTSQSDEWSTPQKIFDELNEEFEFDLDPCATSENHKCERFYTIEDDGLSQKWGGMQGVLQSTLLTDCKVG